MTRQRLLMSAFALVLVAATAWADDDDPPERAARLSFISGTVSFQPGSVEDWVPATLNRPMTTGDRLWTEAGSRAELHFGSAAVRMNGRTNLTVLNLDDGAAQFQVSVGAVSVRLRRLADVETFELDTPQMALTLLRPGEYRIEVNEQGDTTIASVRGGEAEANAGSQAVTIHPREQLRVVLNNAGADQPVLDTRPIPPTDPFDNFCEDRDRREDMSVSAQHVSRDIPGYSDLDSAGVWREDPQYGWIWAPQAVAVGWAPYRYGHWAWIAPWGWTWVDDAPWGFAPFHYGRWVVVDGVWGWVPAPPRPVYAGAVYVRPVYAPALVAFVGGPHWGVGVAVGGGGGGVAWFPLGPRDVYCPSYHVSQTYVTNVNVSNTTIVNRTQITNVYNNVYVNKTVNVTNVTYQNQAAANAVTAVSHQAFVSAQPVHTNLIRVSQKEFTAAPVAPIAPAVAPEQRSVLGAGAAARVRPPSQALSRPVVAKVAPPPPAVPFVKQQEIVRENGGRPPAIAEMRRAEPENVQAARPNIKMAPPVRQGPAQNAPMNRADLRQENGNRPGPAQNAPMVRPDNANRPAPPNVTSPPNQSNRPGNGAEGAGNSTRYNDRPPSSRPGNSGAKDYSPQLEQKHQQELQDLRNKQDQERQKVEQQQVQQRQKLDQERQKVEQQQVQQQQKLDQDNARRQQQQADQRQQQQTEQRQQQQTEQRQQQLEQRQNQQLHQLEQKHDQQQQRLEQRQQQEHQKPSKQEAKQDKPSKSDKPHR